MRIRCWAMTVLLVSTTALAGPPAGTARHINQAVLQMSDTLRLELLKTLARGDIAGAIALWEFLIFVQATPEAPSGYRTTHCILLFKSESGSTTR